MENKPKNLNAFPITLKDNNNPFHRDASGMTLRDYFAAKALQGTLSDLETVRAMAQDAKGPFAEYLAQDCYKFADAMLKEREK